MQYSRVESNRSLPAPAGQCPEEVVIDKSEPIRNKEQSFFGPPNMMTGLSDPGVVQGGRWMADTG